MERLIGTIAKLPDGQRVVIEEVENGLATCRCVDGEWKDDIGLEVELTEVKKEEACSLLYYQIN